MMVSVSWMSASLICRSSGVSAVSDGLWFTSTSHGSSLASTSTSRPSISKQWKPWSPCALDAPGAAGPEGGHPTRVFIIASLTVPYCVSRCGWIAATVLTHILQILPQSSA